MFIRVHQTNGTAAADDNEFCLFQTAKQNYHRCSICFSVLNLVICHYLVMTVREKSSSILKVILAMTANSSRTLAAIATRWTSSKLKRRRKKKKHLCASATKRKLVENIARQVLCTLSTQSPIPTMIKYFFGEPTQQPRVDKFHLYPLNLCFFMSKVYQP